MNIDIAPETAQLVREEIDSGRFRSVDELIKAGLHALRERNSSTVEAPLQTQADNLSELLLRSPFAGADLDLERAPDFPRHIGIE